MLPIYAKPNIKHEDIKRTYWKQVTGSVFFFLIPIQQTATVFISIFLTRMTLTSIYSPFTSSFGNNTFTGQCIEKEVNRGETQKKKEEHSIRIKGQGNQH
jgi:hypothetical protein